MHTTDTIKFKEENYSTHRRLSGAGQWRVIQTSAPPDRYDRRRIFIRLVDCDSCVHTVGPSVPLRCYANEIIYFKVKRGRWAGFGPKMKFLRRPDD